MSCQQVGRYIQHVKDNKYKSNKDIIPEVAEALTEIWKKASVPVQPIKNVKTKLLRLVEEASVVSKQGMHATKSKKFMSSLDQLFDIAGCQCADLLDCKCEKNLKVPRREHEFLTDQRTGRHMKIGGVDVKTSQMIKKGKSEKIEFRKEEKKKSHKKRRGKRKQQFQAKTWMKKSHHLTFLMMNGRKSLREQKKISYQYQQLPWKQIGILCQIELLLLLVVQPYSTMVL